MSDTLNVWYVPKQGLGFTSDPKLAKVDLTGAPIIAPGHLRRIIEQRKEVHAQLLEQLWEKLLDTMEEYFITAEKVREAYAQPEAHVAALKQDRDRIKAEISGLQTALAIMEYGFLYQQDPEAALGRIKQTARQRYDQ